MSEINVYKSPGHHQDWFNCIRTRSRPVADVEIGAGTITTCHLSNIAWWLDRPKRKPYNWI